MWWTVVYLIHKCLVRICQNVGTAKKITGRRVECSHTVGIALREEERPVVHDGGAVVGGAKGVTARAKLKLAGCTRWDDVVKVNREKVIPVWSGLCVNYTQSMQNLMDYKANT